MTEDKKINQAAGKKPSSKKDVTASIVHTKHIRDQLQTTAEIVRTLKKDLNYHRSQHDELLNEKKDLLKVISQIDGAKDQRSEMENELRLTKDERSRLANELHVFQKENEELIHRCSTLELALTQEQRKNEESKDVIMCLEAQVDQLESMVNMIREHKAFMKEED